jgi:hypothetical protein
MLLNLSDHCFFLMFQTVNLFVCCPQFWHLLTRIIEHFLIFNIGYNHIECIVILSHLTFSYYRASLLNFTAIQIKIIKGLCFDMEYFYIIVVIQLVDEEPTWWARISFEPVYFRGWAYWKYLWRLEFVDCPFYLSIERFEVCSVRD